MKLFVETFSFNPYSENTYLVYNEDKACVIIDPGMYEGYEQTALAKFIKDNDLKPETLLNTHCHLDHVFGNKFIFDTYGLKPQFHQGELPILQAVPSYAPSMGFTHYELSPLPEKFLPEQGEVPIGDTALQIIFAPGHSPAHLCFYHEASKFLIGGDVLFQGSIGRTDLPGGNHKQLIENIKNHIFTLPDDVVVYPGHGPSTTIGFEKAHNPFF